MRLSYRVIRPKTAKSHKKHLEQYQGHSNHAKTIRSPFSQHAESTGSLGPKTYLEEERAINTLLHFLIKGLIRFSESVTQKGGSEEVGEG